jgi:hypothetical protein
MRLATILIAAAMAPVWGQTIKLPASVERLASKAEGTVEITMDKSMLKLAGRFLGDKGDEAKARKVVNGLDSIYVRSFSFAREGEYNPADLDSVRAEFQTGSWMRIVGVRSKQDGDNVDVFLKAAANGQLGGAVVISARPKELTIVHISGTLDPDQLADLGGQFHIPALAIDGGRR